jgi:hypothetical protein
MRNLKENKKNMQLFLIVGILVLCVGFSIMSCGTKPQKKVAVISGGHYALDFTDCPLSPCRAIIDSNVFEADPTKRIGSEQYPAPFTGGKDLTLEAWIKINSDFSGTIFGRLDSSGTALYLNSQGVSPSSTTPRFAIRRVVPSPSSATGTSTVEYIVDSNYGIGPNAHDRLGEWIHVAGILSSTDHTGQHAACGGAEAQIPHMDIYIDGVFQNCASTIGNNTAAGDPDPTPASEAYAQDPITNLMAVGVWGESGPAIEGGVTADLAFDGKIDEVRLWTADRTSTLNKCKDKEISLDGSDCGIQGNDNLVAYFRFDEGSGHIVNDWAGLGSGGKEYPNPNATPDMPVIDWEGGWTKDVPSLSRASWSD